MSSGGPGSGLFKSVDGGEHWTELTRNPGMPAGIDGKIGVSVSPVDGNRVYAIIENRDGGVFVSDDAGATWKRTNDSRDLRQRAFYYTRITADPKIKDRVYVTNVQFFRSDDGGKTFKTKIKVPHGDNHDLWIASNDNQRMIEGNDGGANVSVNGVDPASLGGMLRFEWRDGSDATLAKLGTTGALVKRSFARANDLQRDGSQPIVHVDGDADCRKTKVVRKESVGGRDGLRAGLARLLVRVGVLVACCRPAGVGLDACALAALTYGLGPRRLAWV